MFRDQLLPVLQDPVVESRAQLQFTELFDSLHDVLLTRVQPDILFGYCKILCPGPGGVFSHVV